MEGRNGEEEEKRKETGRGQKGTVMGHEVCDGWEPYLSRDTKEEEQRKTQTVTQSTRYIIRGGGGKWRNTSGCKMKERYTSGMR